MSVRMNIVLVGHIEALYEDTLPSEQGTQKSKQYQEALTTDKIVIRVACLFFGETSFPGKPIFVVLSLYFEGLNFLLSKLIPSKALGVSNTALVVNVHIILDIFV